MKNEKHDTMKNIKPATENKKTVHLGNMRRLPQLANIYKSNDINQNEININNNPVHICTNSARPGSDMLS